MPYSIILLLSHWPTVSSPATTSPMEAKKFSSSAGHIFPTTITQPEFFSKKEGRKGYWLSWQASVPVVTGQWHYGVPGWGGLCQEGNRFFFPVRALWFSASESKDFKGWVSPKLHPQTSVSWMFHPEPPKSLTIIGLMKRWWLTRLSWAAEPLALRSGPGVWDYF